MIYGEKSEPSASGKKHPFRASIPTEITIKETAKWVKASAWNGWTLNLPLGPLKASEFRPKSIKRKWIYVFENESKVLYAEVFAEKKKK